MANFNDKFVVERGFSIDGKVDFIYGHGNPGSSEDSISAGVGSIYSQTDSGSIWKKISTGSGVAAWAELINHELPVAIKGVTVPALIDQVYSRDSNFFVWAISATLDSDQTQKFSCIISASNNATSTADAESVLYETHSVLKTGVIPGLKVSVVLGNKDDMQTMALQVEATSPTTFVAYRLLKNYASSKMIDGVVVASEPIDPLSAMHSGSNYTYNPNGTVKTVTQLYNGFPLVETYAYNGDGTISALVTNYKGKTRTETFTYVSGDLKSTTVNIV